MIQGPTLVRDEEYMLYFRISARSKPLYHSIQPGFVPRRARTTLRALFSELASVPPEVNEKAGIEDSSMESTRHRYQPARHAQNHPSLALDGRGLSATGHAEATRPDGTSQVQSQHQTTAPDEMDEMMRQFQAAQRPKPLGNPEIITPQPQKSNFGATFNPSTGQSEAQMNHSWQDEGAQNAWLPNNNRYQDERREDNEHWYQYRRARDNWPRGRQFRGNSRAFHRDTRADQNPNATRIAPGRMRAGNNETWSDSHGDEKGDRA